MKKYIYEEVNGEIKTKLNPEFKKLRDKKIYNIMLKFSKIPLDYYELDFENFSNNLINSKEELNKCIKYAKECKEEKFKKISLYLVGENSSGKSTIACAIGKEFIRQGLIVKFVYAGTLISYLMKNSLFNREEESLKELEELKNCDLIIIDDAMDDKKSSMWKGESKNLMISEWDTFFRNHLAEDGRFIITSNLRMSTVNTNFSKSLYELLDRNFIELEFKDDIKSVRKNRFKNVFD